VRGEKKEVIKERGKGGEGESASFAEAPAAKVRAFVAKLLCSKCEDFLTEIFR
jgi:hypothetical protein